MCPIEICGEAVDGLDALAKTRKLKPDLLILDLSMPHMKGFSVASQIRNETCPQDSRLHHSYLPRIGTHRPGCPFDGFVLKSNAAQDLIRAVNAILAGGKFYGPENLARAQSV